MKDLEKFLKDITRIADSLEVIAKKQVEIGVDMGVGESVQIAPQPISQTASQPIPNMQPGMAPVVPQSVPENIQPTPVAVPVSNEVPTYTQDDLARAMGRAIDDMGKMADIQNIVSSFGVQSLMEIPQEKYPELVQKLKVIGVEV